MSTKPAPMGWETPRRLEDDLRSLQVDLLSARCTVHRLKTQKTAMALAKVAPEAQLAEILANLREVMTFLREVRGFQ